MPPRAAMALHPAARAATVLRGVGGPGSARVRFAAYGSPSPAPDSACPSSSGVRTCRPAEFWDHTRSRLGPAPRASQQVPGLRPQHRPTTKDPVPFSRQTQDRANHGSRRTSPGVHYRPEDGQGQENQPTDRSCQPDRPHRNSQTPRSRPSRRPDRRADIAGHVDRMDTVGFATSLAVGAFQLSSAALRSRPQHRENRSAPSSTGLDLPSNRAHKVLGPAHRIGSCGNQAEHSAWSRAGSIATRVCRPLLLARIPEMRTVPPSMLILGGMNEMLPVLHQPCLQLLVGEILHSNTLANR